MRNSAGKKIKKVTTTVINQGGTNFKYAETEVYTISGAYFNGQMGVTLQAKCYDMDYVSKDYIGKTHNMPIETYLGEDPQTLKFTFYDQSGTKSTGWVEAEFVPKLGIAKQDTMQSEAQSDSSDNEQK